MVMEMEVAGTFEVAKAIASLTSKVAITPVNSPRSYISQILIA